MQTWMDAMAMMMDETEEWISDTDNNIMENNEAEKMRERKSLNH